MVEDTPLLSMTYQWHSVGQWRQSDPWRTQGGLKVNTVQRRGRAQGLPPDEGGGQPGRDSHKLVLHLPGRSHPTLPLADPHLVTR